MLTKDDAARVFDTILSIPGMNEVVKIDLKVSRKNVLLLNHVIERGLVVKDDEKGPGLLGSISPDGLQELKTLADECLQKAGLNELSEKLQTLSKEK